MITEHEFHGVDSEVRIPHPGIGVTLQKCHCSELGVEKLSLFHVCRLVSSRYSIVLSVLTSGYSGELLLSDIYLLISSNSD